MLAVSRYVTRQVIAGQRTESLAAHAHPDWVLTWVETGAGEVRPGNRRSLEAAPGSCVLVPAGFEIRPRFGAAILGKMRIATDTIGEAARELGVQVPLGLDVNVLGAEDRLTQLVRLFLQEAATGLAPSDPMMTAMGSAIVYRLVRSASPLAGGGSRPDRRIRRALEAMRAGYRERLTVDDLASAADMSRYAFLHAFRAQVGASPYKHLTDLRLERAAEQLRATRTSVLKIARAHGFPDPSRFARAFRARYGCTPRTYRLAVD